MCSAEHGSPNSREYTFLKHSNMIAAYSSHTH